MKILKDGKEDEFIYRGSCIPLDISQDKMVDEGNCLNFSDGTAKSFLMDGMLRYEVNIDLEDWTI